MKNTLKKIVFFGTEDFSLEVLRELVAHDYQITAVVTKPDSKKGRGQKLTPPSIKIFAQDKNIPVWQPVKLADITQDIISLEDVAAVLVSYGKIIPQATLDLFSPGIINVHPSLLPKYRGPSPIEAAIANGDQTTGVTIMKLSEKMDAGPIYASEEIELTGQETKPELYKTLAKLGSDLLIKTLPDILSGNLKPKPQNDNLATYCRMLSKQDSLLDPSRISAGSAERLVRAHLGFPGTKVNLGSMEITITKASVGAVGSSPLDIRFKDGNFLILERLRSPNGKVVTAKEFLNGYAGKLSLG